MLLLGCGWSFCKLCVACCVSFVACWLPIVVRCVLFVGRCWLSLFVFVVCRLLVVVICRMWLRVAVWCLFRCALLVMCCVLLVVWCSLCWCLLRVVDSLFDAS